MHTIAGIGTVALGFGLFATSALAAEVTEPAKRYLEMLVNERFANAILMTDQDCSVFGEGWVRYENMAGRFPLGVGKAVDDRDESADFQLGDRGGAYRHMLSYSEMPIHHHVYHDTSYGALPEKVDHGDDRAQEHQNPERKTKTAGGNQPHNNMPPYLALNFCRYRK